jgi:predicted acetyltransferase
MCQSKNVIYNNGAISLNENLNKMQANGGSNMIVRVQHILEADEIKKDEDACEIKDEVTDTNEVVAH